jgi:hypothetical protein
MKLFTELLKEACQDLNDELLQRNILVPDTLRTTALDQHQFERACKIMQNKWVKSPQYVIASKMLPNCTIDIFK